MSDVRATLWGSNRVAARSDGNAVDLIVEGHATPGSFGSIPVMVIRAEGVGFTKPDADLPSITLGPDQAAKLIGLLAEGIILARNHAEAQGSPSH